VTSVAVAGIGAENFTDAAYLSISNGDSVSFSEQIHESNTHF